MTQGELAVTGLPEQNGR